MKNHPFRDFFRGPVQVPAAVLAKIRKPLDLNSALSMIWMITLLLLNSTPSLISARILSPQKISLFFLTLLIAQRLWLNTVQRVKTFILLLIALHTSLALAPMNWARLAPSVQSKVSIVAAFIFLIFDFLLLIQIHLKDFELSRLTNTLRALVKSLILGGVMFTVLNFGLQRIYHPSWIDLSHSSQTGMTFELNPGAIEEISLRNQVAYRVQLESNPSIPSRPYWRAGILTYSSGLRWGLAESENLSNRLQPQPLVTLRKEEQKCIITQQVYPSGSESLEFPIALDPPVAHTSTRSTTEWQPQSWVCGSATLPHQQINPEQQADYLQQSTQTSPRVQHLLSQWRGELSSSEGARKSQATFVAQKILHFFQTAEFRYTRHPKPLTPSGTSVSELDRFIFETREGFCEHYAGAFATLMRGMGIPARVVVGYLGGYFNPYGNYWLISFSDAHAWAEIWDGQSWLRVDPTEMIPFSNQEARLSQNSPWTLALLLDSLAFHFQHNPSQLLSPIGLNQLFFIIFLLFLPFILISSLRITPIDFQNFSLKAKFFLFRPFGVRLYSMQEVDLEFKNMCAALEKQVGPREPQEGFESYRNRIIKSKLCDTQKDLLSAISHAFRAYQYLKYRDKALSIPRLRVLSKKFIKVREILLRF